MKMLMIELNHSEERVLKRFANSQVRTPENLARYFIVKGLGLVDEPTPEKNKPAAPSTFQAETANEFVTGDPS